MASVVSPSNVVRACSAIRTPLADHADWKLRVSTARSSINRWVLLTMSWARAILRSHRAEKSRLALSGLSSRQARRLVSIDTRTE